MTPSKKASLQNLYFKIDKCDKECRLNCNTPKIRCQYGSEKSGAILIVGQNPSNRPDPSCEHPWGGLDIFPKRKDIIKTWLKDAWITNLVKCTTPKNERLRSHEIKTCSCWLEQEIEIINPSKIIALGKYAENWFNTRNYRGVVPFRHPNYINRWHAEQTEEYLAKLKNILIG